MLFLRSCHKLSMKGLHRMLLQIDEDVWRVAVGDDYLDAGIGYIVGGLQLGNHAASAVAALLIAHIFTHISVVIYRRDDARGWERWVAIVNAIHIGE